MNSDNGQINGNRNCDVNLENDVDNPVDINNDRARKQEIEGSIEKLKRNVISVSSVSCNSKIKSKIKCLNTNAQSLQFKMDELKQVIREK